MPGTRTDVHAPSTFDPAAYEFVGAFDRQTGYPADSPAAIEKARMKYLLTEQGFKGGNWETKGYCDHCGAWNLRYICVFLNATTGEHIATGEICAEEAFGHVDRMSYEVSRLKKLAAAERERLALVKTVDAFFDDNRDLLDFLTTENEHYIIADIARKLRMYGSLSTAQIALVRKIKGEQEERANMQTVEEVKIPAPEGRVPFTGKVVAIKEQWSDYAGSYGEGGMIQKLVVKMPEGFTVWVTRPSKINPDVGDIVSMTATLSRSDRDESFAFGKRPSKAVVVEAPVEGASSLD